MLKDVNLHYLNSIKYYSGYCSQIYKTYSIYQIDSRIFMRILRYRLFFSRFDVTLLQR
jgi:hypothetical protein